MTYGRRQYPRHLVQDETLFVFCEDSTLKGWVTDISSHGMGFRYFPGEKFKQKTKAKIILAGDKISVYIPDVPCKIIHNHKIDKNNLPFKGTATRRIGVQFEILDSVMKGKLAEILGSAAVMACVLPEPDEV